MKTYYLAQDVEEIKWFILLAKIQDSLTEEFEKKTITTRTPSGNKSFVRLVNDDARGERGILKVWKYISAKYLTEEEEWNVGMYSKKYRFSPTGLLYDLTTRKLEMIGAKSSKLSFIYYKGIGYTIKKTSGDERLYHHPSPNFTFDLLKDPDDMMDKADPIVRSYFKTHLNNIQKEDTAMEDKYYKIYEFIKFMNLTEREKTYIFGRLLLDKD
jgi:hypothetical protein